MAKTVVVTLRTASYCQDFVLPTDVVLGELYPRLIAVLHKTTGHFSDYQSIILEINGAGLLDQTATLLDYGVCTGMYLDVVRKEKYDGFR